MIFNKPKNITITQMAKWLDCTLAVSDQDKNTQVEYLYHLITCFAKQAGLFKDEETYDDFALCCITKVLIRINNTEEEPVKSFVNYIKKVLPHWHADYIRTFCYGTPEFDLSDYDITDFGDYLIDSTSECDYKALLYNATNVTQALKLHLKKIPHKHNSAEWQNICLSCFLTLEDRVNAAIMLTNQLAHRKSNILLSRLIRGLKNRPPILFHIDESKSAYISVLVNELIHVIAVELTNSLGTTVSPTDCLKNMAMAASNEEDL